MLKKNTITTNIELAVAQLQAGNLVAFPSETVYGLGADARNPAAIQKVFATKGRPANHPVIVHIWHQEQLKEWARDIPAFAWDLATRFWPGPLTFILPKQPWVSELITGGQDTIAIRIPKHDLTLDLLHNFSGGIVGPSANKFGRVSPTTAQHVAEDLQDVDLTILDGGACTVGIESTIVDLTSAQPIIRRLGAITAVDLGISAAHAQAGNAIRVTRVPGSHTMHYAPHTPVKLMHPNELLATIEFYLPQSQIVAVMSLHARPAHLPASILWQQMSPDPALYAQHLYAALRQHDLANPAVILIENPDSVFAHSLAWAGVIDRLTRACA